MHQSRASAPAYRLDANANKHIFLCIGCANHFPELGRFFFGAETDFRKIFWKLFGNEVENFLRLGGAGSVLNARINIFGVLAEDDHIHSTRVFYGRRDSLEPPHRSKTHIQIQYLPQGHIK